MTNVDDRDRIGPSILVGLTPGFPYMMPPEFLPLMDCQNCVHIKNPELGHCYMFRVKPDGDHCGQFKAKDAS